MTQRDTALKQDNKLKRDGGSCWLDIATVYHIEERGACAVPLSLISFRSAQNNAGYTGQAAGAARVLLQGCATK